LILIYSSIFICNAFETTFLREKLIGLLSQASVKNGEIDMNQVRIKLPKFENRVITGLLGYITYLVSATFIILLQASAINSFTFGAFFDALYDAVMIMPVYFVIAIVSLSVLGATWEVTFALLLLVISYILAGFVISLVTQHPSGCFTAGFMMAFISLIIPLIVSLSLYPSDVYAVAFGTGSFVGGVITMFSGAFIRKFINMFGKPVNPKSTDKRFVFNVSV